MRARPPNERGSGAVRNPRQAHGARSDAPELFALLDRLRARLDTPPLHQVLVTADFNAGITQLPRLGVFGWHRNSLILGSRSCAASRRRCSRQCGPATSGTSRADTPGSETGSIGCGSRGIGWFRHWRKGRAGGHSRCAVSCTGTRRISTPARSPLARNSEFEADAASVAVTSREAAAQALRRSGRWSNDCGRSRACSAFTCCASASRFERSSRCTAWGSVRPGAGSPVPRGLRRSSSSCANPYSFPGDADHRS